MAVYKVPQDVEAEDKLIGPFSFRQFIYLIIAALGILLAWGLSRLFIGLIIVPLPIIALFLILALPLRKDQPMETYLTAVIRFFLKPRKRLWSPEGTISLVEITVPKVAEFQLTKDFSGSQAAQQLSYLAQVVDTQGWSTRGVVPNSSTMNDIVMAEAQATEDILDENTGVAQAIDQRIVQTDQARRQATLAQFQQAAAQPQQAPPTALDTPEQSQAPITPSSVNYNPYPESMRQHIINPSNATQPQAQPVTQPPKQAEPINTSASTSSSTISPDIIRLANNNDLSISTLAREAHRLTGEGEEVEISLR